MAKLNQNFQIYKGEIKNIIVTIRDAAGDLVELNGRELLYRVTKSAASATPVIEKNETDMSLISLGVLSISFTHADTDALKSGLYQHELRLIAADTVESVVMKGDFKLDDASTNVVATP